MSSVQGVQQDLRRLSIRVRHVPGMPLVAARLWLRGGASVEDIPGQALVTGRLLTEGTRQRSWDRIALEAESRGMAMHSFGSYEALGITVDALLEDWQLALQWLAEMALESTFPADRLQWIARQASAELESQLDQPEVRTARAFQRQLYGTHPYGRPLHGSSESLNQIKAANSVSFHQKCLGFGGCLIVTGGVDEAAVRDRLESLFTTLEGPPVPRPALAAPSGTGEELQEIKTSGTEQAHLYMGHLTVARNHPDAVALDVLAVILGAGAGLVGRLPRRIREQQGLAYSVDAATAAGSGHSPGRLVVYVATAPETVRDAERSVREELNRLRTDGVEEQEFEEARSYLLGRDPFRRETARQWADLLAEAELYGLPSDRPEWVVEQLQALDHKKLTAIARKWVRPEDLKVTVGLPG